MVCSSGFSGYLLCLIIAEYSTGDKRQERITPRLLSAAPAAEEMNTSQHSGPGDQSIDRLVYDHQLPVHTVRKKNEA
ncbi:hypothetical protein ASPTUDRAFT_50501 [Aspergillus tubingensis CBS 134.48]|uniref:Uncharacterized protein n=1 Tax=Aspergillus tubingensis (strain CBS 134.48) TaxID=767770 RepID=A0A1L9NGZ1_ASPTC|nr:hypothetical protein ASPTUDRAFT_50501 [Aspergillus tubingensis CBS 134.48]